MSEGALCPCTDAIHDARPRAATSSMLPGDCTRYSQDQERGGLCAWCRAGHRGNAPVNGDSGFGGPTRGYGYSIPWEVHERAWTGYHARYPNQQDAARIAERGGFGASELDEWAPGWRDEAIAP